MTDAILVKQKIVPGKTEQARALFKKMGQMRNSAEVIEVLNKEGVYTESAFLQRTNEGDFVLYYIEAEDGEQVYEIYRDIVADPEEEAGGLEKLIYEFNSVMDGEPFVADVEPLYHVVNPDRSSGEARNS